MSGLSPKLPITRDPTDGFSLIKTMPDLIKQNLKNLVLTSPGERVMDINFGVGIRDFLFEQNTDISRLNIERKIREQVEIYMPFLSIEEISFSQFAPIDSNKLQIGIYYIVPSLGLSEFLLIFVDLI